MSAAFKSVSVGVSAIAGKKKIYVSKSNGNHRIYTVVKVDTAVLPTLFRNRRIKEKRLK